MCTHVWEVIVEILQVWCNFGTQEVEADEFRASLVCRVSFRRSRLCEETLSKRKSNERQKEGMEIQKEGERTIKNKVEILCQRRIYCEAKEA